MVPISRAHVYRGVGMGGFPDLDLSWTCPSFCPFRRFQKGVGGRGLATNKPPKRAQKVLQKCVTGRRATPGRFGSLAFAMKNRHFGRQCSWIPARKARKCGKFWVLACVPNPGKQRIWRQCPPSARKESTKKLPNHPAFTHVLCPHSTKGA